MKGKITKDIFLRVGKGVMRIPRENKQNTLENHQNSSYSNTKKPAGLAVKDHSSVKE